MKRETSAGWNTTRTVRVNRLALAVGIPKERLKCSLDQLDCMASSQNVDIDRLNDVLKQLLTFTLDETQRQRDQDEREAATSDDDSETPWYAREGDDE